MVIAIGTPRKPEGIEPELVLMNGVELEERFVETINRMISSYENVVVRVIVRPRGTLFEARVEEYFMLGIDRICWPHPIPAVPLDEFTGNLLKMLFAVDDLSDKLLEDFRAWAATAQRLV